MRSNPPIPPRPDLGAPRARSSRARWWVGGVAAIVAIGAIVGLSTVGNAPETSAPRITASFVPSAPEPTPTPAAIPPRPPDDDDYAFIQTYRDRGRRLPIRWNPCQPIRYQVNLSLSTPGAMRAIRAAIARASAASGIPFVFDGHTRATVDAQIRRRFYSDRTFRHRAPVLIAVVSHERFLARQPTYGAVAYAHPEQGRGVESDQWVSGFIVVDGSRSFPRHGRWSLRLVLLHELGHLLGLGHVRAPDELMFSFARAPAVIPDQIHGWGPGDRSGLYQLGSARGCMDVVDVAGGQA